MGKDLKGKELGVGITQQKNGLYNAGFVDKLGVRRVKRFKKLQECRKWLDEAKFIIENETRIRKISYFNLNYRSETNCYTGQKRTIIQSENAHLVI